MMRYSLIVNLTIVALTLQCCGTKRQTSLGDDKNSTVAATTDTAQIAACHVKPPSRFATAGASQSVATITALTTDGMVLIPGGRFQMGADNDESRPDERPKHPVQVSTFWMDATEVTNAQFRKFAEATGYVTTAERTPDWEELRKQLPPGTPKPDATMLVASSLVFKKPTHDVSLNDYSQWWQWMPGADWQHPDGPGSTLVGKDTHPVVHVSWDDAQAYAKWAGKRLPTEAEWEWAARGSLPNAVYPWGNEPVDAGKPKANSWQGKFPTLNTRRDGFATTAPVKSFAPNGFGLYDMAGNVWEWCSDHYRPDYYVQAARMGEIQNPSGPAQSYDPDEPSVPKRVMRGGSFLCNDLYCSSYRSSARMKSSPDTGLSHTGFRCVRSK